MTFPRLVRHLYENVLILHKLVEDVTFFFTIEIVAPIFLYRDIIQFFSILFPQHFDLLVCRSICSVGPFLEYCFVWYLLLCQSL